MTEATRQALETLRTIISASANSDPSFDANRRLKKEWADKLAEILKEEEQTCHQD